MTTTTRRDINLIAVERAAAEAFVFGYPLVLMGWLRAHSPVGAFRHERPPVGAAPPPDTLGSSAWLDLRDQRVVLSVPEAHGQYYVLSLIDMWTRVFASIGPRTTGTSARRFAIGGPRLVADALPPGVLPITAPTDGVRIAGQTRLEPAGGTGSTWMLQNGLRLEHAGGGGIPYKRAELADPGGPELHSAEGVARLDAMDARAFLNHLEVLLAANPPPPADHGVLARLRDARVLPLECVQSHDVSLALDHGFERARARIHEAALPLSVHARSGWRVRPGASAYGDHLGRAAAAYAGLETAAAGDEVSATVEEDHEGRPLHGGGRYELRFDVDRPPPVHGFWSLAAFGDGGCRARLGSDDGLTVAEDGTLTIHVQPRPPAAREQRANWLAIPAGPFRLLLRMFWPGGDVLAHRWMPPPLSRVA
jgi:hypothetical protein